MEKHADNPGDSGYNMYGAGRRELSGGDTMGKERNTRKEEKKKPAKSLKEKRREKKQKKQQKQ